MTTLLRSGGSTELGAQIVNQAGQVVRGGIDAASEGPRRGEGGARDEEVVEREDAVGNIDLAVIVGIGGGEAGGGR